MKKVLFIIAQKNFRDEELLDTKEVLEKNDHTCIVASITTEKAYGSQDNIIKPDIAVKDVDYDDFDIVILVGGVGAMDLEQYDEVKNLVTSFFQNNKKVAAICIAPMLLARYEILTEKKATVFKTEESLRSFQEHGVIFEDKDVIQDGNIITANGPHAAKKFGKTIATLLYKIGKNTLWSLPQG